MNVLVTTNQLGLGGAEHFVVRLANGLTSRGHRVVVASERGVLADRLDPQVTFLEAPARAKTPWALYQFSRVLAAAFTEHRIDVVHANSPTTALAARWARGEAGPAIVTTAHGSWKPWTKPMVARLFAMGSDRVMGCSEALTSDLVRHGLDPRKAVTIHNGIPFRDEPPDPGLRREVRREFDLPEEAPLLLAVARLSEEKGIAYLLEAMPRVWSQRPEARLLVAGDGPEREALEQQAAALGDRVRILGTRPDVPRLLAAADAFCLPSLTEGLPLALAEAMASGVPAVASAVGGVPELIQEGVSGFLVPPRSPQALADKLLLLLSQPALAQRLGQAGREQVRGEFTLERMLARFEAVYHTQSRLRLIPIS